MALAVMRALRRGLSEVRITKVPIMVELRFPKAGRQSIKTQLWQTLLNSILERIRPEAPKCRQVVIIPTISSLCKIIRLLVL